MKVLWTSEDGKHVIEVDKYGVHHYSGEGESRIHAMTGDHVMLLMLREILKLQEAIHSITPWLSASLSEKECSPEYEEACNKLFKLDPLNIESDAVPSNYKPIDKLKNRMISAVEDFYKEASVAVESVEFNTFFRISKEDNTDSLNVLSIDINFRKSVRSK